MVSYDYDLFLTAQNDCNNAITSLPLLSGLISKLQSCPLPKIVQSYTISGIVSKCNIIKNDSGNLQNVFTDLAGSLSELNETNTGLNEEYDKAVQELSNVDDEIWEFTTSPTSGRPTVEDVEKMRQKIARLNEKKENLENEIAYLGKILGIETVEEKKWYEVLGDTITQFYEDEVKLTDSYKNIFTNETSGGFISNVSNYFATLAEVRKKEISTNQQTQTDIFRGVGNFIEKIGDFATQSIGSYIAMESGRLGGFSGADKAYETIGGKIKEETKAQVTQDTVDNMYYDYYQTEKGKAINDHSYVKYDDALAKGISDAAEAITETGAVLAVSTIPGGAAIASALTGTHEGGNAVNKAYDNGATFDEATLYGDLMAGVYGGTAYLGSDYFSNTISKGGKFIPTGNLDDALKVTFGYKAGAKEAVKRMALGTGVPTLIPAVDSIAEWATWGSDYHDLKDLGIIWNENKTTQNMALAGLTGLGLTTANELAGSLVQGKYLKKNLLDTYSEYGLKPKKIDEIMDNITYLNDKDFGEFYKTTANYDSKYPEMYKYIGGNANSKTGKITMNLDWKDAKIDDIIGAVYHESNHRIGKISGWIEGGWTKGYNETFTEIMANRTSGKVSSGYSPKATALVDRLETIVDPSKQTIIKSYIYDDIDPLYNAINSVVGDDTRAEEIVKDLNKYLNMAVNMKSPSDILFAEQQIQGIVDLLDSMK